MVGSEICKRLAARSKQVRAMVRSTSDQAKIANLQQAGIEMVAGDLRDRASLAAACQGVSAVIATVSAMPFSYHPIENNVQQVDQAGLINLIDMAKAAGVRHFIYTSFQEILILIFHSEMPNVKWNNTKNSGKSYTILRPSYFMEVWLSSAVRFDAANTKVQRYGNGTNPTSYISYLDVAEVAVASLENSAARNVTLELGGPESISQLNAVKIFEQVSGRKFEVQYVPENVLQSQRETATDPMQQSFTGLMQWLAQGDPIDMKKTQVISNETHFCSKIC